MSHAHVRVGHVSRATVCLSVSTVCLSVRQAITGGATALRRSYRHTRPPGCGRGRGRSAVAAGAGQGAGGEEEDKGCQYLITTELRTHDKNLIRNVFKLNFGKVSPTNQINERKVLRSACSAAGARCAPCAAGDARRAGYRCGRRAARCADCLRCDALRAGWLHSRGAL
jgi:hypothetical protein